MITRQPLAGSDCSFWGHLKSGLPGYGAGVIGGDGYTDKLEWKEYKLTRKAIAMASPHYFGWKLQNMECCVYKDAKANILQNLTQLVATCVNKTYSAVFGEACNLYLQKCKQGSRYLKVYKLSN